ncbi:hypothetical protein [Altericista sp. CCNU0014]|uniref:hypothetical protein n=1 Tax=Altericista sp. CCNU0014 TaxID=3082949 RepID=UPI00385161FD
MPLIRIVLVALSIGIAAALVLQNAVPLTITILGIPTQPISLGLALLLSVLLGLLVGALLQYLLQGAPALRTPRRPWFQRSARKAKTRRSKASTYRSSRTASHASASDWYQPAARDWHGRPSKVSATEYDARTPGAKLSPEEEDYDYDDTPQQSRWSHLFEENENGSDSRRRERKQPGSDRVVDADYRVIRPPSRPLTDPEWDDEFFEDRP